jgi:hypothetical protein
VFDLMLIHMSLVIARAEYFELAIPIPRNHVRIFQASNKKHWQLDYAQSLVMSLM